ncbi:MAG: putative lipid II flippase FtsW [Snodgrassella sp.]|uniref:Probable peptidoglycan glycosyltransferase FtsW n=1 Tax=Snodgrassella alvi TaxID=1196083 RepID=A0A2N9XRP1_9NEIS|nr:MULTISPECIES: putative lipid II flippase FtsW [Snodgrassella]MCO6505649.1 putative lipid II flippase FtsW [Snodgrassella sp.]MCO6508112.1 putative lipid II flippase FtsW [Snodgrassella sp.]MCO6513471.1 putative lipid II flippase FtsW [Snodgrassella sp.]MCO6515525.1 putative lipid II flippase FtsW [Snodgrassella sp.]MCO6517478.1 putative lipid II flippase FtsW [Snodgrassella sp.]
MITESRLLDRNLLRRGDTFDQSLLWMVVLMASFSLIMVYSASIAYAQHDGGSSYFYLIRQAVFLLSGGVFGCIAARIPLRTWKKLTPLVLLFSIMLLIVVLVMGREINGAKRWINMGMINIQPTEVFKLAIILYLSSFFTRRAEILKEFKKVWFAGIPIGLGLGLIMLEPDFGSFVVVSVIAIGLLFLAGLPFRWFMAVVGFGLLAMIMLVLFEPYRMARIAGFLDPWADPLGKGYQLTHSLMAIGRGGWFGVGLGASLEKRFYLPEAHTDFILAVIGEEFGFVGILVLMFCYIWLMIRAFSIGKQARDLELFYGSFVAKGIGIWIGIQSFFNIGVNIGLLPTKGLTLPLLSYGGSAVMIVLICVGLLLRVDYENRRVMRGFKV